MSLHLPTQTPPVQPERQTQGIPHPGHDGKQLLGLGAATKPKLSPIQVGLGSLGAFPSPQSPAAVHSPLLPGWGQAGLGEPGPHGANAAPPAGTGVTAAAQGFSSFLWKNLGFPVMP